MMTATATAMGTPIADSIGHSHYHPDRSHSSIAIATPPPQSVRIFPTTVCAEMTRPAVGRPTRVQCRKPCTFSRWRRYRRRWRCRRQMGTCVPRGIGTGGRQRLLVQEGALQGTTKRWWRLLRRLPLHSGD